MNVVSLVYNKLAFASMRLELRWKTGVSDSDQQ